MLQSFTQQHLVQLCCPRLHFQSKSGWAQMMKKLGQMQTRACSTQQGYSHTGSCADATASAKHKCRKKTIYLLLQWKADWSNPKNSSVTQPSEILFGNSAVICSVMDYNTKSFWTHETITSSAILPKISQIQLQKSKFWTGQGLCSNKMRAESLNKRCALSLNTAHSVPMFIQQCNSCSVSFVVHKVHSRFLLKQEVCFYLCCTEQLLETDSEKHQAESVDWLM